MLAFLRLLISVSKSDGLGASKLNSFPVFGCKKPKVFACKACLLKFSNFFLYYRQFF